MTFLKRVTRLGRSLEPLNPYPPIYLLWEEDNQVEGPFALDDIPEVTGRYRRPPDRARYQGGNQWGPYPAFLDLLERVEASEKLILRMKGLELPLENRDEISIAEAYRKIYEKTPPPEPESDAPIDGGETVESEGADPGPEDEAGAAAPPPTPKATPEQIERLDKILSYFSKYAESMEIPHASAPGDVTELLEKLAKVQSDAESAKTALIDQCLEIGRDVYEIMDLPEGADPDRIIPAVLERGMQGQWNPETDLPPIIKALYPGVRVNYLYSN